jgi:hypothetical protein
MAIGSILGQHEMEPIVDELTALLYKHNCGQLIGSENGRLHMGQILLKTCQSVGAEIGIF